MTKLVYTAAAIVFEDNKVLLVRHKESASHKTGALGLPSGKIDPGETAKQTAQRELEEEGGLVASADDFVEFEGNHYVATIEQKTETNTYDWTVFLCKKYSGEIKGSNETEPFWVEISELPKLDLLPNVRQAVLAAWKSTL